MDFGGRGGYQSRNVIEIIPVVDPWPPPLPPVRNDEPIWETEDDYGEQSPGKKSQSEPPGNGPASKSNSIGKMFFKTKFCCKFRLGSCPYVTNCNFAHGMEELRDPPPNWQNIMAAADEDRPEPREEQRRPEPREEQRIPILTSSTLIGEGQRFFKGRHCKKFYTEGGCPYGENCTYLHDDQSKARENMAISVINNGGGGGYGGGNSSVPSPKLSNWKTRMCNKWEMTGFCPFGSKCHFAHGAAELHRYGGGLVEVDGRDASSAAPDSNQAGPLSRAPMNTLLVSHVSVSNTDAYATYHMGVPEQRSAVVAQRQGQMTPQKWKGPNKISRIYGDWIDEFD